VIAAAEVIYGMNFAVFGFAFIVFQVVSGCDLE
jgi:hypothetical protein